jgi:hypothetical protein
MTPVGQQTLTVSTTAVGFTASNTYKAMGSTGTTRQYASLAYCTVEDNPARVSVVGTPTASTGGHEFAAGTEFYLNSADEIRNFLAIRTGGSDAVIHATFYA